MDNLSFWSLTHQKWCFVWYHYIVCFGIVVAGIQIDSLVFSVSVRLKLLFLQLFRVVVLCFCSRPAATTSKPKHTRTYTNTCVHEAHRENQPTPARQWEGIRKMYLRKLHFEEWWDKNSSSCPLCEFHVKLWGFCSFCEISKTTTSYENAGSFLRMFCHL